MEGASMNFLNSGTGYALFLYEAHKKAYVDKSLLIHEVYQYSNDTNRYICITRPRRFGKTVAANMIAAFLMKAPQKKAGFYLIDWKLVSLGRIRCRNGKETGTHLYAGLSKASTK